MKYLTGILMMTLMACSEKSNIAGTYVCSFEHEFGKTDDTLIVTEANSFYQIDRRSGTQRKLDGELLPKELLTEFWTLEYNPSKKVMIERKSGKTLQVGRNKLILGKRQYRKI